MGSVTVAFAVDVALDRLIELGEMAHVVFGGPPLQVSARDPVDPLTDATLIVYVAFLVAIDCEPGLTDRVNETTFTDTGGDVLPLKFELPS